MQDSVGLQTVRAGPDFVDEVTELPRILKHRTAGAPNGRLGVTGKLQEKPDVRITVGLPRTVARDSAVEDLDQLRRDRDLVREQVRERTQVRPLGLGASIAFPQVLDIRDLDSELADRGWMQLEPRSELLEERAFPFNLGGKRGLQLAQVGLSPDETALVGEQRPVSPQTRPAPTVEELVDLGSTPGSSRHEAHRIGIRRLW